MKTSCAPVENVSEALGSEYAYDRDVVCKNPKI